MSEFRNFRARLPRILMGLAVGVSAAFLFSWLNTPLPWLIGPLVSLGIANLCGAKLDVVPYGRHAGQWSIGTAVGLYFSPAVLLALLGYVGWIFATGALVMAVAASGGLLLSRLSGVDRTSCFFATVPGGAAEMSLMAERYGGSVPAVAIAQAIRIAMLVLIVPPVLTYAGFAGIDRSAAQLLPPVALDKWLLLMAITGAGCALFMVLKLQNPWMMGPLITGAALSAAGVQLSAVPAEVINAGQIGLGMALGARFDRDFFLRYRLFIPFAVFNAAYLIIACAALSWLLAWASGIPFGTMLAAATPGGMVEMAITAKVLELGVALVTAFQFVRILMANFSPPILFPVFRRLAARLG